jgi:hypothetical protein
MWPEKQFQKAEGISICERGAWRPRYTFFNLYLEDKLKKLLEIIRCLELFNPKGQLCPNHKNFR